MNIRYCLKNFFSYSVLSIFLVCPFVLFSCTSHSENLKQTNRIPAEVAAFEASIASSYRIENMQDKLSAEVASGCDIFEKLELLLTQYGQPALTQDAPQGLVVYAYHNSGDLIGSYAIAPEQEKGYRALTALYETALLETVTIEQGMATVELPVHRYGGDVYDLNMLFHSAAENAATTEPPPLTGEGYTVRYHPDAQTISREYLVIPQGMVCDGIFYEDTAVYEMIESLFRQRHILPLS